MPRIRRWFHVSHDINSDGEVWELTDKFGVAGLRLWLELLSIGDRNEGQLPALTESSVRQLSIKCNTSQTRVRLVWDFGLTRSWIVCDPVPRLRNYREYNPSREAKKLPLVSPPNPPNPPNLPDPKKEPEPASPEASLDVKKPEPNPEKTVRKMLDPVVKIWADKVYQTDPVRFASLIRWIKQAEKEKFENAVIAAALERFLPYCHTITDWWPYLDKLIYKVKADMSRDRSQSEHDKYKGFPVPQGLLGLVRRIEK